MSLRQPLVGFCLALSGRVAYSKLLAAPVFDAEQASVLESASAAADNSTATPCPEECIEAFRICGANMTYSYCRRQMKQQLEVFQSGACPNPWCTDDQSMKRMEAREIPHKSDSWPAERPTSPTLCTAENRGRCDCASKDVPDEQGRLLRTFTWWYAGQQRCFTEYVPPPATLGEYHPRSVLLNLQCNANDRLDGIGFKHGSDLMDGADRFNFIAIGLSTPNIGAWDFGNGGVVNDKLPQPCSATYSDDIVYIGDVLKHLRRNHRIHDGRKIFLKGFSQNSMFAAFSAYCFPAEVAGLWQVSSGLAVKGLLPVPPRKESVCSRWAYDAYGDQCDEKERCESCKYFPIYPCHFRRPMVHCLSFYTNDEETASNPDDPTDTATLADNMFNIAAKEGHDVRLLRFQPQGKHISGGHQPPGNGFDWLVGCLGMAPRCSPQCATALSKCMAGVHTERRVMYNRCLATDLVAAGECNRGCAPTKEMLFHLERPSLRLSKGFFGEPPGGHHHDWNLSQPDESVCSHWNTSYVTTRPSLKMRRYLEAEGLNESSLQDAANAAKDFNAAANVHQEQGTHEFQRQSDHERKSGESEQHFVFKRKDSSSKRESADARHRAARAGEHSQQHSGHELEAKALDARKRFAHAREDSQQQSGAGDAHHRPQHAGREEAEEARARFAGEHFHHQPPGEHFHQPPGYEQQPEGIRRFLAFEGEDSQQHSNHKQEADEARHRVPYTAKSSSQNSDSARKAEHARHHFASKGKGVSFAPLSKQPAVTGWAFPRSRASNISDEERFPAWHPRKIFSSQPR